VAPLHPLAAVHDDASVGTGPPLCPAPLRPGIALLHHATSFACFGHKMRREGAVAPVTPHREVFMRPSLIDLAAARMGG
jgi:hypothetical protein